ncbi:hypothetical protein [Pseudomonas sp.]|uniref:hypothetical protein n=1 Tax=Pseudomonas sp. TaxID=306 RepID=UPI0039C8D85A
MLHVIDRNIAFVRELDQALSILQRAHTVVDRHATGEVFVLKVDDHQRSGGWVQSFDLFGAGHRTDSRVRIADPLGCQGELRGYQTDTDENGLKPGRRRTKVGGRER